MSNYIARPTNQIYKIQTKTKLICALDKLKQADMNYYAQIHAKGEYKNGDVKVHSLIGISIFDYTKGTGDNNVVASFNLAPEELQFILSRVNMGVPSFVFEKSKIFGAPDENGLSTAQRLQIIRRETDSKGNKANSPWYICISNGKGKKCTNDVGGSYMQGGSYREEKKAYINLTDIDIFTMLTRIDSYIRNWELLTAMSLIPKGRNAFAEYIVPRGR